MKTKIVLFFVVLLSLQSWSANRTIIDERNVVLNGSHKSHLIDAEPEATIGFASGALTITLDATHYASYTVTLTSPAGDSVTVNATSPTVTIPVNGDSDGYVVTIDGGDYGTYDGVFSRSGASTVTLTDQQA